MRTRLLVGLAIAGIGLLSACAGTPTAAPAPTAPPVTTSTSTTPTTVPSVPMPSLPKVAAADETIVKEAPPPPPAGVPCDAGADACIDLSANKSWLLADGAVSYGPVPITHGMPGWETPPGTFQVGWKHIDHKSSQFNNAPMPYSVFFNGGIAFHQGSLTDQSHGCIHLSWAAAEAFYNGLSVGDTVQVVP